MATKSLLSLLLHNRNAGAVGFLRPDFVFARIDPSAQRCVWTNLLDRSNSRVRGGGLMDPSHGRARGVLDQPGCFRSAAQVRTSETNLNTFYHISILPLDT